MFFMALGVFFYCKKDSMECDENEVSAYIYFSHLFLFTGFKIGIEILYQSKWKEHRHLYNTSWLFLFITPFLVLLLTLGFVSFSKLRNLNNTGTICILSFFNKKLQNCTHFCKKICFAAMLCSFISAKAK